MRIHAWSERRWTGSPRCMRYSGKLWLVAQRTGNGKNRFARVRSARSSVFNLGRQDHLVDLAVAVIQYAFPKVAAYRDQVRIHAWSARRWTGSPRCRRHSGKLWLVAQRTGNGKTGLRVFGLRAVQCLIWAGSTRSPGGFGCCRYSVRFS